MFDRITFLAGVDRESTGVNRPRITTPLSTTLFAFSTVFKKQTTALLLLDAARILLCPTTSPIAKMQSSTLAAAVTLNPWRRVSEPSESTPWAAMPSAIRRSLNGQNTILFYPLNVD